MKNYLIITLSLAMIHMALISCGTTAVPTPPSSVPVQTEQPAASQSEKQSNIIQRWRSLIALLLVIPL